MAVIACCALLLSLAGGSAKPLTPLPKPTTPPAQPVTPAAEAPPFLMDVNDLYVIVDVRRYPIPDPDRGAKAAGPLESLVQARLEKAKFKVRTNADPAIAAMRQTLASRLNADPNSLSWRPADAPILLVTLNVLYMDTGTRAALYVQTSMTRPVRLVDARGNQYLHATIWSTGPVMQSVMATRWENEAKKVVLQQVESFLTASRPAAVRSGNLAGGVNTGAPATSAIAKAPAAPTAQATSTSAVVSAKIGSEFHRPDCPVARVIGAQSMVTYRTREEALAAGKRPCKSCNP